MNWEFAAGIFVAAIAGATIGFVLKNRLGNKLKLLLAFSGAYLLALTLLHLLPEIFAHDPGQPGLFILVGFLLQIILEYFSKGVEHGHLHKEDMHAGVFPLGIFISLCLHSLVEGMPLGGEDYTMHLHAHHNHSASKNSLFIGIMIHKIPESIALTLLLASQLKNKSKAIIYILIFALTAPLGIVITYFADLSVLLGPSVQTALLSIVVGIFLHVSTTILFESTENHRFNFAKLTAVFLGFLVCMLTL